MAQAAARWKGYSHYIHPSIHPSLYDGHNAFGQKLCAGMFQACRKQTYFQHTWSMSADSFVVMSAVNTVSFVWYAGSVTATLNLAKNEFTREKTKFVCLWRMWGWNQRKLRKYIYWLTISSDLVICSGGVQVWFFRNTASFPVSLVHVWLKRWFLGLCE